MDNSVKLTEKYERNGWPSVKRPDLNPPAGLNLSLLTSLERIRSHALSSQGQISCIKDGERQLAAENFHRTAACSILG